MRLTNNIEKLTELIKSNETVQAMEIFYSDNIEMQENEDTPRKGKTACIHHEKVNLHKVKNIQNTLLNQVIDEEKNIVFSEWEFLVTGKDGNKYKLTEVSVQHWLDGQVIKEKFYYKKIITV